MNSSLYKSVNVTPNEIMYHGIYAALCRAHENVLDRAWCSVHIAIFSAPGLGVTDLPFSVYKYMCRFNFNE